MTKTKKENQKAPRGFYLSCERTTRGISMIVGGIMNVSDFSSECIMLAGHGGRIQILGKRLNMSVFENGDLEIQGTVEDIKFIYGKA